MNKEEQIAIETLKEVASDNFDTLGDDISPKMAQNILNVINKQQKEIEELKEKNKELDKENQGLFELYNFNDSSLLSKILKDYKKIIAKQQKEIEDLNEIKQQICNEELITQDYVQDNFIAKVKIRELIKELEDYMILFTNDKEKFNRYKYARNILEKLLKEN